MANFNILFFIILLILLLLLAIIVANANKNNNKSNNKSNNKKYGGVNIFGGFDFNNTNDIDFLKIRLNDYGIATIDLDFLSDILSQMVIQGNDVESLDANQIAEIYIQYYKPQQSKLSVGKAVSSTSASATASATVLPDDKATSLTFKDLLDYNQKVQKIDISKITSAQRIKLVDAFEFYYHANGKITTDDDMNDIIDIFVSSLASMVQIQIIIPYLCIFTTVDIPNNANLDQLHSCICKKLKSQEFQQVQQLFLTTPEESRFNQIHPSGFFIYHQHFQQDLNDIPTELLIFETGALIIFYLKPSEGYAPMNGLSTVFKYIENIECESNPVCQELRTNVLVKKVSGDGDCWFRACGFGIFCILSKFSKDSKNPLNILIKSAEYYILNRDSGFFPDFGEYAHNMSLIDIEILIIILKVLNGEDFPSYLLPNNYLPNNYKLIITTLRDNIRNPKLSLNFLLNLLYIVFDFLNFLKYYYI